MGGVSGCSMLGIVAVGIKRRRDGDELETNLSDAMDRVSFEGKPSQRGPSCHLIYTSAVLNGVEARVGGGTKKRRVSVGGDFPCDLGVMAKLVEIRKRAFGVVLVDENQKDHHYKHLSDLIVFYTSKGLLDNCFKVFDEIISLTNKEGTARYEKLCKLSLLPKNVFEWRFLAKCLDQYSKVPTKEDLKKIENDFLSFFTLKLEMSDLEESRRVLRLIFSALPLYFHCLNHWEVVELDQISSLGLETEGELKVKALLSGLLRDHFSKIDSSEEVKERQILGIDK